VQGEFKYTQFKFLGESLLVFSDAGEIYTALSEDFLIQVRDSNGMHPLAFYHPAEKRPFTREEALRRQ